MKKKINVPLVAAIITVAVAAAVFAVFLGISLSSDDSGEKNDGTAEASEIVTDEPETDPESEKTETGDTSPATEIPESDEESETKENEDTETSGTDENKDTAKPETGRGDVVTGSLNFDDLPGDDTESETSVATEKPENDGTTPASSEQEESSSPESETENSSSPSETDSEDTRSGGDDGWSHDIR